MGGVLLLLTQRKFGSFSLTSTVTRDRKRKMKIYFVVLSIALSGCYSAKGQKNKLHLHFKDFIY